MDAALTLILSSVAFFFAFFLSAAEFPESFFVGPYLAGYLAASLVAVLIYIIKRKESNKKTKINLVPLAIVTTILIVLGLVAFALINQLGQSLSNDCELHGCGGTPNGVPLK